ncbi:sulfite exporter TauE/SafE family protein [bacterium]|nr:sulfite exporter TauE/SafE family protein [bacterium]
MNSPIFKFCLFYLFLFLNVSLAYGHQPDKVFQETRVFLKRPLITIQYRTTYGEVLAKVNVIQADKDEDGQLSPEEKSLLLQSMSKKILSKLELNIDGENRKLTYVDGQLSASASQHLITQLIFELSVEDLIDGRHTLFLTDNNFPDTALGGIFYAVDAGAGSETAKATQDERTLSWSFLCDKNLIGDPVIQDEALVQDMAKQGEKSSEENQLSRLLKQKKLSPWFIFWALLIAIGMGALHALSPGHGKAMVAAYLVGEKGTVRDAIVLGSIVTLTHVSSVVLLGIVALILSEFLLPQQLYPWFGVISGALIFIVGFWMLARRTLGNGDHSHSHEHHHSHSHDVHSHVQEHGHSHLPKGKVTLSSLLLLGISGGMVPCPAALVVLLAAITMHRIVFGLSLIFAFSIGLASVLILIGVLVVKSTKLMLRSKTEAKWLRILPVFSAGIIMLIGIGIAFNALLSAGIINVNFGL